MKENYYKKAPTWLYNLEGGKKLCQTQEQVDAAWEEGWFGPANLFTKDGELISQRQFETRQEILDAVAEDPRYVGLTFPKNAVVKAIAQKIVDFERENLMGEDEPEEDLEEEDGLDDGE